MGRAVPARYGWGLAAARAAPRARRTVAPVRPASRAPGDSDDPRHGPARPARDRHDPDALDRRRPEGQLRASRARRWARRRWRTRCGRATSATPRPTRHWPDPRPLRAVSAGHASMLLYSLLHLTGYDVTLDDLKSFRQWGSKTPGHPEYGLTPGVEATTGPLGQGFANAVGMAIAERRLAAEFNRAGPRHRRPLDLHALLRRRPPGGHRVGGGSLAGHLRLGKLIALYDDNHIQLDGPTALAFTEDVARPVRRVRLARPARRGRQRHRGDRRGDRRPPRPTTGRASSRSGPTSASAARTSRTRQKAHGSPLGADEVRLTKEAYGWDPDKTFYVPDEALELFRRAVPGQRRWSRPGSARSTRYADAHPDEAAELRRRGSPGACPTAGTRACRRTTPGAEVATRNASQDAIQALAGAAARAVRRRRRPVRVQPDRRQGRRADHFEAGRPRAQPPVRRPRARDGRDRQRHRLPRRVHPVRRDVPHVQRLHARRRSGSRRSAAST